MECRVKISSSSTLTQSHPPVYVSVFTCVSIYILHTHVNTLFFILMGILLYIYIPYTSRSMCNILIFFFNMSESSIVSVDAQGPNFYRCIIINLISSLLMNIQVDFHFQILETMQYILLVLYCSGIFCTQILR